MGFVILSIDLIPLHNICGSAARDLSLFHFLIQRMVASTTLYTSFKNQFCFSADYGIVSTEASVSGMMNVIAKLGAKDTGKYTDYEGHDWPW